MSLFPSALEVLRRQQELEGVSWWARQHEQLARLDRLRGTPAYLEKALEILSRPTPISEYLGQVAIDPNDEMLDADESDINRREFEAIARERRKKELLKGLSADTQKAANELWDGEHLTDAIEKTMGAATHPQAMWSIDRSRL